MEASEHYNREYFDWQRRVGEFGGYVNSEKFSSFIRADDRVLDFGCGGGFLLSNLKCRERLGIEINGEARREAQTLGIKTVASISEVIDGWADVIVSNNVLEHTDDPLGIVRALRAKLREGGKAIFVVPCDSLNYRWKPQDINQHLFSWSPMNLGNLFVLAGFSVETVESYMHKWPPKFIKLRRLLGPDLFRLACHIYARIDRRWNQVRIVAVATQ